MKVDVQLRRPAFDGTGVRYKVYTPGDGIVTRRAAFVCSPLSDTESWDSLCRKLARQGCLCVTFELPGFGHTPVKAPQDNITRAKIMWGVLDEVEIGRNEPATSWHLVSHGSGCGVIMEMARRQPESVLSRVLISPVTHRFAGIRRIGNARRWLYTRYYEFMTGSEKRFAAKYAKLSGAEPDKSRVELLYREFRRPGRMDTIIRMFESGYRVSRKAYGVECPIMLIWGKDDPFGSRPDEKLLAKLQDVEVHYIRGGHMTMETMPQEISEYLKGWCDFVEGRIKSPSKQNSQNK